ncbi:hypothetical protein M0811_14437 [Anaeramoeba ignava]|uniref:Uncharacterized protein n=1 Tax=Anaeramoeba ignava TaxID=1746090 RepID=A0A9Q0LY46_ANAIG|nr:hypothetical protein M0811_14437 [Anaeramoeba ignava]
MKRDNHLKKNIFISLFPFNENETKRNYFGIIQNYEKQETNRLNKYITDLFIKFLRISTKIDKNLHGNKQLGVKVNQTLIEVIILL